VEPSIRLDDAARQPASVAARSPLDEAMRRLLRIRPDDEQDVAGARSAFSTSLLVSTVRCLLTYVLLPVLRPVIDLSGGVGPVLGLVVSVISAVAIIVSMRRFWAADHRARWAYTAVGGGILVLLVVQSTLDVVALFS